jgi:hypothetical protein
MLKIPLMDYVGRPLLTGLFLALLLLQWRFPLRRQHFKMLHRLVRNFVLSIPGFAVVRLAMFPVPISIAMWAQEKRIRLIPAGASTFSPFCVWVVVATKNQLKDRNRYREFVRHLR